MKKIMKKFWFILSFLFLVLVSYTIRFRYSTSEMYKKSIINEQLFTWDILTIRDSKNFSETIYYPIKDEQFKLCINWANILASFFVYDILWYKEYKLSSSSQIINMWNIACLELADSQKIFSDTEISIKNILRNTFLDKWWKLVWITLQLAPLSWENIVIKSFSKDNKDRVISEFQKRFDTLEDMPIVTNKKVQRTLVLWEIATWRISTHDYPSLGIKVYSDDAYSKSFEREAPFIVKNEGMIIDPFSPIQRIKVIAKYPDLSIEQIFERDYSHQFPTSCTLEKVVSNILTGNTDFIEEYRVTNQEWNCFGWWDWIHQTSVSFFYNTNNPDRYYLYSYGIGCAPGKCNIFNKIELY